MRLRPVAWALAIAAVVLSASGWFMLFGLLIAVPAAAIAWASDTRWALRVAVVAATIALMWIIVDAIG